RSAPTPNRRPPVRLVVVAALLAGCSSTTSAPLYEAAPLTPLTVTIVTDPPAGPEGAARNALSRIGFDDYPDPDSVAFGAVLLRSGRASFDAELRVDLPGRVIVLRPRALLQPMTSYEVFVAPEMRALDGREVGGAGVTARIDVGEALAPDRPAAPRVTWNDQV